MHIITSLELLGTLITVRAKKAIEEISRPHMLKSFFLSQKKLINIILRVKLQYMKEAYFSLN